jgi:hypothetical protein
VARDAPTSFYQTNEIEIMGAAMEKIYLGGIQDVGYFKGTENQLHRIFRRSREREWTSTKVGSATEFSFATGGSMYWWEDSGDVMFRATNLKSTGMHFKKGADNLDEKLNSIIGQEKMAPIAEQFFRDPHEVLWDYFEKEYSRKEHDIVMPVIARAANVKIPKTEPSQWEVAHRWTPRGGFMRKDRRYLGFEVRPKNTQLQRFRGTEIVDDFIDLSLPYFMSTFGPKTKAKRVRAMNEAIRSLMREYDKNDNSPWDRKRCVQFFSDDNNFV